MLQSSILEPKRKRKAPQNNTIVYYIVRIHPDLAGDVWNPELTTSDKMGGLLNINFGKLVSYVQ
jgi:hypothetical protein